MMTAHLEDWSEARMESYKVELGRAKVANQVTEALLTGLKKQAANLKVSDKEREAIIDRMTEQEIGRVSFPPSPRMFASDITEERLFQRMHERGGEYAVLSGEGRPVMDNIMGRYSGKDRTGDGIYLAGVTGDTITRDRVGNENGPEDRIIINPCLNVCVMLQPDKYLEVARHPALRASGALARIRSVWLPSLVGARLEEPEEPGLNGFILEEY